MSSHPEEGTPEVIPRRLNAASVPVPATAAALALIALFVASVQLVAAGQDNVTVAKSTDAVEPVAPGGSYTYEITATVGALPVTEFEISDGSIDFPQVAITAATVSVDGGSAAACSGVTPANVDCAVGRDRLRGRRRGCPGRL
jgi:hypothetical protein